MANTPFLNLVKPTDTDQALITDINNNSDKIDTGVSTLSEQIQHYYDTDGKLYRLPPNADLDSITESGRYYFGSNVTNKPASSGGYLDVYAYDTSWIKQVAYLEGSDAIYVRTKTGSSWSSWNNHIANTGAWYEILGSKSSDGNYTLADSYTNYKSVVVMLFGSSNSIASGIFPTTMLITAGYKPTVEIGSNTVTVQFTSTTTVTISNLNGNVRIYGLK